MIEMVRAFGFVEVIGMADAVPTDWTLDGPDCSLSGESASGDVSCWLTFCETPSKPSFGRTEGVCLGAAGGFWRAFRAGPTPLP